MDFQGVSLRNLRRRRQGERPVALLVALPCDDVGNSYSAGGARGCAYHRSARSTRQRRQSTVFFRACSHAMYVKTGAACFSSTWPWQVSWQICTPAQAQEMYTVYFAHACMHVLAPVPLHTSFRVLGVAQNGSLACTSRASAAGLGADLAGGRAPSRARTRSTSSSWTSSTPSLAPSEAPVPSLLSEGLARQVSPLQLRDHITSA